MIHFQLFGISHLRIHFAHYLSVATSIMTTIIINNLLFPNPFFLFSHYNVALFVSIFHSFQAGIANAISSFKKIVKNKRLLK